MDQIKKLIDAGFTPTRKLQRMLEHTGDVSEGSKGDILAKRVILGKQVIFYKNGARQVEGIDLDEQEIHDSELLRLAHVSLLINDGVGDRDYCYVDARQNPVEVILYGLPAERAITRAVDMLECGALDQEEVLNTPIKNSIIGV